MTGELGIGHLQKWPFKYCLRYLYIATEVVLHIYYPPLWCFDKPHHLGILGGIHRPWTLGLHLSLPPAVANFDGNHASEYLGLMFLLANFFLAQWPTTFSHQLNSAMPVCYLYTPQCYPHKTHTFLVLVHSG